MGRCSGDAKGGLNGGVYICLRYVPFLVPLSLQRGCRVEFSSGLLCRKHYGIVQNSIVWMKAKNHAIRTTTNDDLPRRESNAGHLMDSQTSLPLDHEGLLGRISEIVLIYMSNNM